MVLLFAILLLALPFSNIYTMEDTRDKDLNKPSAILTMLDADPLDEESVLKQIEQLIVEKSTVNLLARDAKKETAFSKAINKRSLRITQALLSMPGQHINIGPYLATAISEKFYEITQLLIEHGALSDLLKLPTMQHKRGYTFFLSMLQKHVLTHNNVTNGRLLIQGATTLQSNDHRNFVTTTLINRILPDFAMKLALDGVVDERIKAHLNSHTSFTEQSSRKDIETLLAYAFAQRMSDCFTNENYRKYVNNEALLDRINTLIFDHTRVRSQIEKDQYLPVWINNSGIIGKAIARNILLVFTQFQTTSLSQIIPYDIKLIIISWVIGKPLLKFIKP